MGILVNRNKALRTGCVCYKLPDKEGELMCYSPGIVGVLDNAQELQFCSQKKEVRPASKNLIQSQKLFSTAVQRAGDKYYKSGEGGIAQWGALLEEEFGKPGREVQVVEEIGEDITEIPIQEPERKARQPRKEPAKSEIPKFKPLKKETPEVVSKPKVSKGQKVEETFNTFKSWVEKSSGDVVELDRIWDIVEKNKQMPEDYKKRLYTMIEASYDIRRVAEPKKVQKGKKLTEVVSPAMEETVVIKGEVAQPVQKAKPVSKKEFETVQQKLSIVERADYYRTSFMNPYKTESFINQVKDAIKTDDALTKDAKDLLIREIDGFWKDKQFVQESPTEEEITETPAFVVQQTPETIGGTELPPQEEILKTATQIGTFTPQEYVQDFNGTYMVLPKDYKESIDKTSLDRFDGYRNSILNNKGKKGDLRYISLLVKRDDTLTDDLKHHLQKGIELNMSREPFTTKESRFREVVSEQ